MHPSRPDQGPSRIRVPALFAAAGFVFLCAIVAAGGSAPVRSQDRTDPQPQTPARDPIAQEIPSDEGPEPDGPLVAPGPRPDLVLLYTGGVIGYVEPCGCPRNPAGGLARRAGYRDLIRESFPDVPVMFLDTGDFTGSPDEAGRLKTTNLHRGMDRLGVAVSNVGERELFDGVGAFLDRIEGSPTLFTSATYLYRDTGEPVFAPFALREVSLGSRAIRIGFLGVNAHQPTFTREDPAGRVVITGDPAASIQLLVPAVRRSAELVVLLANLNARDLAAVLSRVSGIDLVLATDGERLSPGGALQSIAGVPVLYSGDQGKRLGEVRVFLDGSGARFEGGHVWLTRRYPPEPGIQTLIDATLARVNQLYREIAERETAPAVTRTYLSGAACSTCHEQEHAVWAASRHAHAFRTLIDAGQEYNPECVSCHVTGFNTGGFVNARQTPDLANVQCEACHGGAAGHPESPERVYGDAPPRTCFVCHTKENSPDFVFFPYWEKIRH